MLDGPVCSQAKDAAPTAEDLLKRFEAALKATDKRAIMELFDWQGVSDDNMKEMLELIGMMLSKEAKNVRLAPLPADFQGEAERDGVRYRPNVKVVGVIEVQYAQESMQLPYGKKNNAFYLSNTVEEKVSPPPAVKEKLLNVSIQGTISPKPVAFEGSYVYLKGGKQIKEDIVDTRGTGNVSLAFWGDRIQSCRVRKISSGGKIRLVITEDGKEVFKSEWETTDKPIVYETKH